MPRDVSKYVLDGEDLLSVTEILKLAGFIDLSRIPWQVLEEARLRGSGVHDWIELVTKTPDAVRGMDPPPILAPYVAAWEKWRLESGFEVEGAEEVVVSERYLFAGTLDVWGRINGKLAIVDYKALATLTAGVGVQLSGYEIALNLGEPVLRLALHLKKDGTYRFEPMKGVNDRHDFLAANRVAHWQLNNGITSLDEIRRAA